jgi:TRAP-type mannitol/chloroaromatic compound transport system permease large subunit
VTWAHIYSGITPHILMSIILLIVIIAVPAIATWLPAVLG